MSKVNRIFSCTIDEVEAAAAVIGAALKSAAHGPAVIARMTPTFQDEFDALVARLAAAIAQQSGAKGTVHTRVEDLSKMFDVTGLYVSTAREIAKRALKSNKPVLHTEFTVGHHSADSIPALIGRAQLVHAACRNHAEVLAESGWPAEDTVKLGELVATLKSVHSSRVSAGGTQLGATTGVVNLANAVYERIRLVQISANIVYPESEVTRDSSIVEARGYYLLGVFPPRKSARAKGRTQAQGAAEGGQSAPAQESAAAPASGGGA